MKQRASGLVFQLLVLVTARWLPQSDLLIIDYLREENRVLREQLSGNRLRLTEEQRRRLAVRAEPLGRAVLRNVATLVTPETLLGWYRRLVSRKYDGGLGRRAGRPPTKVEVAALVLRMARENPCWGYTRIRGALHTIGHELGRSKIQAVIPLGERHLRVLGAEYVEHQQLGAQSPGHRQPADRAGTRRASQ